MIRYTRNQARIKAITVNDSNAIRAVVKLVEAVAQGVDPEPGVLKVLAEALTPVLQGQDPKSIFGKQCSLVSVQGRPANFGFEPAHIVSAVVELEIRRIGKDKPGAKTSAIQHAIDVFVDINGADSVRSVRRDLKNGHKEIQGLTDQDLLDLVRPYEVSQ